MLTDSFFRFLPVPIPGSVQTKANEGSGSRSGSSRGSRSTRTVPLTDSELTMAIDRLPPLPAIATRILEVVGSDRGSASDLEGLVRLDPVIAARLLKLVNSPFYGLPNRVASISQAVTMIGFGGVKSLVVAAAMSELLQSDLAVYGFVENGAWKNALACGSMSKAVAAETGVVGDDLETAFLSGLMRDVGLLVLGPELRRRGLDCHRLGDEVSVTEHERFCLGIDHVEVGVRLADRWRLPASIRACIAGHHADPSTWPVAHTRLVAGVRLAERLSFASRIGLGPRHAFDARIDPILLKLCGLDVVRLQSLTRKLPAVIAAAEIPV